MRRICHVTFSWYNPYTSPPQPWPRVVAEWVGERYVPGPLDDVIPPGCGWSMYISHITLCTIKQLPPSKLAAVREKRLRRRIEKKYPLFAEEIIREETEKKRDYYAGKTDPAIQAARDRVTAWEEAEFARLSRILGKGVVWAVDRNEFFEFCEKRSKND